MKKFYLILFIIFVISAAIVMIIITSVSHQADRGRIDDFEKKSNKNTPTISPSVPPTNVLKSYTPESKEEYEKSFPKGNQTYSEYDNPDNDIYIDNDSKLYEDGLMDKGAEHILDDIRHYLDTKGYHGLKALELVPNTVYIDDIQSISFILQIKALGNKYLKVSYDIPTDKYQISEYDYHIVKPLTSDQLKEIEAVQNTYKTKYAAIETFDKSIYKKLQLLVSGYIYDIQNEDYADIYMSILAADKMKEMIPSYDEFIYMQGDIMFHNEWNPPKEARLYTSVAMYYKFNDYYLVKMGFQYAKNGKKSRCMYRWITAYEEEGIFKLLPADITCKDIWLQGYSI